MFSVANVGVICGLATQPHALKAAPKRDQRHIDCQQLYDRVEDMPFAKRQRVALSVILGAVGAAGAIVGGNTLRGDILSTQNGHGNQAQQPAEKNYCCKVTGDDDRGESVTAFGCYSDSTLLSLSQGSAIKPTCYEGEYWDRATCEESCKEKEREGESEASAQSRAME